MIILGIGGILGDAASAIVNFFVTLLVMVPFAAGFLTVAVPVSVQVVPLSEPDQEMVPSLVVREPVGTAVAEAGSVAL